MPDIGDYLRHSRGAETVAFFRYGQDKVEKYLLYLPCPLSRRRHARRRFSASLRSPGPQLHLTAPNLHIAMHSAQPMHLSWSICARTFVERDRIGGAVLGADAAVRAVVADAKREGCVLRHLAMLACAAHAQRLERGAEAPWRRDL